MRIRRFNDGVQVGSLRVRWRAWRTRALRVLGLAVSRDEWGAKVELGLWWARVVVEFWREVA